MNLATRCATCGTMFRVVQDQLKVSEGWVRCGHCQAVFNALESLFDLDHERLPIGLPDPPPAPEDADRIRIEASGPGAFDAASAAPVVDPDRLAAPAATIAASPSGPSFGAAPTGLLRERSIEAANPAAALPSFAAGPAPIVRVPPKRARRSSPALAGLTVVLVLLLATQALVHERNLVAARWPASRPVLTAACAAFACRLELPQSIDDIAVENTGLARTALAGAFQFSVGLRNRGALALAVPSVELSLTDTNGQLVARRVLAAKDFERAPAAIAPGGEAVLQALLATPSSVVSGYTVEAFYP